MMKYSEKYFYFKMIVLLLITLFCYSGCASTSSNTFQKKIETMSDDELLNYYYGINERIKDIDTNIKNNERPDASEHDIMASQSAFFIGGDSYDLVAKKRNILKELNKRNISTRIQP